MIVRASTIVFLIASIVILVSILIIRPHAAPLRFPEPRMKDPACIQALAYKGELVAIAYESERTRNRSGFGMPLHGQIAINGHCYAFTTGGRKRGSIPPALYAIGPLVRRPYLGGNAFRLSDVYDPFVKDTRFALFVHAGLSSEGCITVDPSVFPDFVADMAIIRPRIFELALAQPRTS